MGVGIGWEKDVSAQVVVSDADGLDDDASERCRSRRDEALEVLLIKAPRANTQPQGVWSQADESKSEGRHDEACKAQM